MHLSSESPDAAQDSAQALASGTHRQFTWLPEYFKSKAEAAVERAQIGGHVEDRNVFWLGRVHTPLCFWITAHHHRPYLQTTHRRRLIDDFEDGGSAEPEPHRNGGTVCAALRTDDVSTDEYDISVHQFNALGGNQLKRLSNELSNSDGDRALFANRLMKPSRHWQLLVAMIQAKLRYKLHRRRLVSI